MRYVRVLVPRKNVKSLDDWVVKELGGGKAKEYVYFFSRKREIIYEFHNYDDKLDFLADLKNKFKNVRIIP